MAQVTLILGVPTNQSAGNWVQWDVRDTPMNLGDCTALSDDPTSNPRYLTRLRIFRGNNARYQLQFVATPGTDLSGFGSREDMSDEFIAYANALTVQYAGATDYVIPGPNVAGNSVLDTSEPYQAERAIALSERQTWFDAYEAAGSPSVTLVLDDGVAPVTTDHTVDAGDVAWAFTLPQPTETHITPTNQPPVVTITTPDMTVDGGQNVPILATATDPDGTINSVLWTGGGTFTPPNATNTVWTAPAGLAANANYALALTATDDGGDTGQAIVTMTVRALADNTVDPTDVAWAFAIPEPTVSHDVYVPLQISIAEAAVAADAAHVVGLAVNVDAGTPTSYAWAQTSGPTVPAGDIVGGTVANLWLLCPHDFTASTLVFQCTVEDRTGVSLQVDSTVTVAARPPVQTQTGKGPTDPLPAAQDAYRFLSGNQLWDNRPGRTITWSNATNTYNLFQDGRQVALDGGPLSARHLLWMRSAFLIWTDIVNVVWSEVADDPQNNLRVGYGDSGLFSLGATSYTNDGRAVLTLNPDLIDGGSILGIAFDPSVARTPRHEVGHVLGLEHPDGNHSSPLMETQSHEGSGHVMEPQLGDIIGAWHLFGPATNAENTAPDAPTSMQFSASPSGVAVAWNDPLLTGGLPITGYTVNGPSEQTTTERGYTYAGLTPGQSYDFYVRATNSAGTGLENRRTSFRVPDVAWAFTLPEPTVTHTRVSTTDHAVDAAPATWAFDLPRLITHKSVTHTPDPADVAWIFALPEPTVTHRQMMAHAVDAGPATWTFALPQPSTGTVTSYIVDANAVRWFVAVPQPRVTLALPMTVPAAPTMLAVAVAGHTELLIQWQSPNDGNNPITNYEYRIGSGAWASTGTPATNVLIAGLLHSTTYSITVRAVNGIGTGPASAALLATTSEAMPPSMPLFVVATPTSGTGVDLTWRAPASDMGSAITRYEICVIDDDGVALPFEATDGPALTWRVRGLAFNHRYGFRVRAVNSAGTGPQTPLVYATPIRTPVPVVAIGQRIPLLDLDRQSLIVRLAGQDCRIRVWWQPSDLAWYGAIEIPVNTQVISGRRLVTGAGLLDRLPDSLPGNVVCRAIDEDSARADPTRDAWRRQTHGIFWEAD